MSSIPWGVTEHALRLILGSKPAKQRLRRFDDEMHRAIGEEITIGAQEVNELAFLFGRELGPDPHRLSWVGGVDSHHLGFLERAEGR